MARVQHGVEQGVELELAGEIGEGVEQRALLRVCGAARRRAA